MRLKATLLLVLGSVIQSGCGNAITCAIKGDNVRGHVNFTSALPPQAGNKILVQYSKDNFSSVATTNFITNAQGLISIPYTVCVDNDADIVLRAFEDTNGNGTWEIGESAGRNDGTSDGNAPFIVHRLPTPQPSATPPVEWKIDEGVDIFIDSTTAQ